MRHYCTYFDVRFLSRGLALLESLQAHAGEFKLWILCMDGESYRMLQELDSPEVVPLSLEDFLRGDVELNGVRGQRTVVEFYFTCTPSLPLYVFRADPAIDLITYLDADLWFTANPELLFEALGGNSIGIISHRFPSHLGDITVHGLYNVGLVAFRRDERGLACLEWWRARCIEWCHDRVEGDRYADQKYLDDWPTRFEGVCVLELKGANLAVWNMGNYEIGWSDNHVTVDQEPLIFFHFHGLRWVWKGIIDLNSSRYQLRLNDVALKRIFEPYLLRLAEIEEEHRLVDSQSIRGFFNKNRFRKLAIGLKALCGLIPNLVRRHYVIVGSQSLWWWKRGAGAGTSRSDSTVPCLNSLED